MGFLASDQKTKEVKVISAVNFETLDEALQKNSDPDIIKILAKEFQTYALQNLGKATLKEMSARERKSILDSLQIHRDRLGIDPKKMGYNWRAFKNKIMST